MAIYHLHIQTLSRGAGRSATAAAAYRSGERIVDVRTGEIHDYTRKRGVDHREILAPDGAPAWMLDRASLWNAVELSEIRSDARVAREMDVALPRELLRDEMLGLGVAWVRAAATSLGMVGDVCFHDLDSQNPHFHVLLTTRRVHPGGFGSKVRSWDGWGERSAPLGSLVSRWRESWALAVNRVLASSGRSERVDHRTLADQGVDRPPTVHLGRWHSINRSSRTPAPIPHHVPRAIPWQGTALVARDRRSRINAAIRELVARKGGMGEAPAVLAAVISRHLRRRLEVVETAEGIATLRHRAAFEPPDVELWIASSRKLKRLKAAADSERASDAVRRQSTEALRLFAADEFARAGRVDGRAAGEGPAQSGLAAWLERVRSRLERWVSLRMAQAAEARRLLDRCLEWGVALKRAEAMMQPIKRAGP